MELIEFVGVEDGKRVARCREVYCLEEMERQCDLRSDHGVWHHFREGKMHVMWSEAHDG